MNYAEYAIQLYLDDNLPEAYRVYTADPFAVHPLKPRAAFRQALDRSLWRRLISESCNIPVANDRESARSAP